MMKWSNRDITKNIKRGTGGMHAKECTVFE